MAVGSIRDQASAGAADRRDRGSSVISKVGAALGRSHSNVGLSIRHWSDLVSDLRSLEPVAQTLLLHTKSTDQEKSGVQPSAPVAHCNMTGRL
jgi:hypothetical protein